MMRKILYIIAAAWALAFLWRTYAHADQPSVQLPDYYLGQWCYDQDSSPNDGEEHYYDVNYECDQWFTVIFRDDDGSYGYFTDLILQGLKEPGADYCVFDKIEPAITEEPDLYLIHAKCESLNGVDPPWEERFELRWGRKARLIIQRLADS